MFERRVAVAFAVALCLLAVPLAAEEPVFRDLTLKSLQNLPSRGGAWEIPLPGRFRALEVDVKALESLLDRAPAERSAAAATAPLAARPALSGRHGPALPHRGVADPRAGAGGPLPRDPHLRRAGDRRSHRHRPPEPHSAGLPRHGAVGVGHGVRRSLPPLGRALRPLLLQERRAQGGRVGLPLRRPGRAPGSGR